MSTIAYKDGVMVSDKAGNCDGFFVGEIQKIFKDHGLLVGCCGVFGQLDDFIMYLDEIINKEEEAIDLCLSEYKIRKDLVLQNLDCDEDFQALIVDQDLNVYLCDSKLRIVPVKNSNGNFFSIGSGQQFAMGAMANGASSINAVAIACIYDLNSKSGTRLDCIEFNL